MSVTGRETDDERERLELERLRSAASAFLRAGGRVTFAEFVRLDAGTQAALAVVGEELERARSRELAQEAVCALLAALNPSAPDVPVEGPRPASAPQPRTRPVAPPPATSLRDQVRAAALASMEVLRAR